MSGVRPRRTAMVRIAVAAAMAAGAAVFIGANGHMVYVAFLSEPECVPHLKAKGAGDGEFRAAKSAC